MSPAVEKRARWQRESKRDNRSWLPAAYLLATVLVVPVSMAEEAAFITNRAFTVGGGKEVDAAVRVLAVDFVAVNATQSKVRLSGGTHVVEVLCTARVLVGMGTADFDRKSALTVQVAAGRTYQLDARVSVRGECTPVLE